MRAILLLLLITTAPLASVADESFPDIEKLMSAEEFKAAGLEKLTPAERQALNQWLLGYTAVDAQIMLRTNEEVIEVEAKHEIHASIKPPFKGWSGKTVFYLDNGQIWRQRLRGRMVYSGDETEVVIRKNFMGFYKMTHIASDRSVGVSLVQ